MRLAEDHLVRSRRTQLYIFPAIFVVNSKKQNTEKPNYPTGPVQFDAPPQMAYPGPHHYQNPFPEYPPVQENHIILDDEGLKTALAVQIEYYFSDANLQKGEQHLGSI